MGDVARAMMCVCLVGCAAPPPPAKAPPTPAVVAPAEPQLPKGSLFVYTHAFGALECEQTCVSLERPGLSKAKRSPRRIAPHRYLLDEGIFDLENHALSPPPAHLDPATMLEEGALWVLDDSVIHIEFRSTHDVLRVSHGGGPFKPLAEPIPPKSYEFAFLRDGRHLFKTAPLMGADESKYFVDVITGQQVTLRFVKALGAAPKPLVTRPQTMHADFVLDGASVVYWVPGTVDLANNVRTLRLERVDVATGETTNLGEVTTPAVTTQGTTWRDSPWTVHHTHSRFVVHDAGFDAAAKPHLARIVDVLSGKPLDLPLASNEVMAQPLDPSHPFVTSWSARRDDDVLVLKRPVPGGLRVRVLALPSLEPVLVTTLPFPDVAAIDFVRH